jgi:hypothetical protein
MYLGGSVYRIHGTNDPSIGGRISRSKAPHRKGVNPQVTYSDE